MKRLTYAFLLVGLLLALAPYAAQAQWKIQGPDENSYLKLGFLAQGQLEVMDTPDTRDTQQNLFLRRFRILGGGQVMDKLTFFFETDSPNIGKYDTAAGKKNEGTIYMQDAFVTYTFRDEVMIDGGLMLIPSSHNSETSAAQLLPVDYGAYSFLGSAPTQSRVGRDYGVQARGYVFDKHLEYRAGIYQGIRDTGEVDAEQDAPFRFAGRIVYHILDPETGFFYSGTSLGKKKILSVGFSADAQETYRSFGGDLYFDYPLSNNDVVTFQADYIYYNGHDTFKGMFEQNTWLYEAGYYNNQTKLGVFGQLAVQNYPEEKMQDEDRWIVGLAYWGKGHNFNLKGGYGVIYKHSVDKDGVELDHVYRDYGVLQCQVMMY